MRSLKLEWNCENLAFLRPLLQETRTVEETAEILLPEGCGDGGEILGAFGLPVMRGQTAEEGAAVLSAAVNASLLVQGTDGMETAEAYIPLSVRVESPLLTAGTVLRSRAELRRIEAHMAGPRRAQIRVCAAVTLWAWQPAVQAVPADCGQEEIELRREVFPLKLLTNMESRTYALEDSLHLSPEGTVKKLAGCRVTVRHTERRLTGTRAVFKGQAVLAALYLDESGGLQTGTASLPFSQYIDLGACDEAGELVLDTVLTGADLEPSADGGINVTLQLRTDAQVYSRREQTAITDLYARNGETAAKWEEFCCESLLDRQQEDVSARGTIPGLSDCAALWGEVGEITHVRSGETAEFTVPVTIRAIAGNGESGAARLNLTVSTRAAAGCRFQAEVSDFTCGGTPGSGGLEVTAGGTVTILTFGGTSIPLLTEAEIIPEAPDPDRPGLTIRRMAAGERLWDVGKQYRASVERIRQANGLSGEPEDGALLLIPCR